MKANYKIFIMLLIVGLVILSACKNSDENSHVEENNVESNNNIIDKTSDNEPNNVVNDTNENQLNDQNEPINDAPAITDKEETTNSNQAENQVTESKKGDYLNKLNQMEEADKNLIVGDTTSDLEKQEEERYEKWDAELNVIYDLLEERLNADVMEDLRTEQREWVKTRDEKAEEESKKYEGGSTEALEYIATQASFTKERCYELVAKYMD